MLIIRRQEFNRNTWFAVYVVGILLSSVLLFWMLRFAFSAGQKMLLHIFLMTVLAPVLTHISMWCFGNRMKSLSWPGAVWSITLIQSLVVLYWHSPSGMALGMHTVWGSVSLQLSLLVVACLFWWQLLILPSERTWLAVLALLVTGKIFCLVALLMTFAPRVLYPAMSLEAQQLAGLIMVTLCPVCYVATAVWLFCSWLANLENADVLRNAGTAMCR